MEKANPGIIFFQEKLNRISRKEHLTEKLVISAWKLAKASLWPKTKISFTESENAKDFIRKHLTAGCVNSRKSFMNFCTRIILAKELSAKTPYKISNPCEWFSIENSTGYNVTRFWYHHLLCRRDDYPNFRQDLKDFSQCCLLATLTPESNQVQKLKEKLKRYTNQNLLRLVNIISRCKIL